MKRPARTQSDKDYQAIVVSLGCVVCRNLGRGIRPAGIHHIREGQGLAQRAAEKLVIPLCDEHHQHGGYGVAIHKGETAFERNYGTELELLNQTITDVFDAMQIYIGRAGI